MANNKNSFPPQHQEKMPGTQEEMVPQPKVKGEWYKGSKKLEGKTAIITGGDSGIGQSVAILYAREGADIAVVYLEEHEDASETKELVEAEGRKCILIPSDVRNENDCRSAVDKTVNEFGHIDILVNNAAWQVNTEDISGISESQLKRTFETNIYSYFFMVKACLPHLKNGAVIINTTSVTAYRGSSHLLDYSSTKAAIVGFTRSLSKSLLEKGIRVNGVAPGPVWTPLTVTLPVEFVKEFGKHAPMKRAAQPEEIAPSYVFLASRDSSYFSGQILHPNGGEVINT
jgi:NAD(P)-dependent dehydrogenase (short-subunit alcohol dehydrogenase family)